MVRRYGLVACRLAAFAIASALMLAGASGAVAVADPGAESAGRNDGNHRADSGGVGSETGDHSASTTRGSGGNGNGRGGRPGDDQTSNGGRQPRSGQSGGPKPAGAESGAGTRASVAPRGIASPPAPETAEVSPGSVILVPASPPASAPNSLGPSVAPRGIASPPAPETAEVSPGSVILVPASPPASAPNSLAVGPRGIASPADRGGAVSHRAQSTGAHPQSSRRRRGPGLAPPIREPSASELSPRQPPPANVGSTAAGQPPYRSGYSESLRNRGPAETAEGALLGVAGIFIMTASGVFIGYRLARAGYVGRTHAAIRFLR